MSDIFIEQLVKQHNTILVKTKKLLVILGAIVLLILSMLLIPQFTPLIVIIVGVIAYILYGRLKVEYEYIFTSGELDIDKIMNKRKRKRLLTVDCKNIEIVAPTNSKVYDAEISKYSKLYDCSSGIANSNVYAILFNKNNQRIKLLIEPNEQVKNAIKSYTLRKFHE